MDYLKTFDPKDIAAKLSVSILINILTALIAPYFLNGLLRVKIQRLNWKIYLLLFAGVAGLLIGVFFLIAHFNSKNDTSEEATTTPEIATKSPYDE